MSNAKEILIDGMMPFNFVSECKDIATLKFLAQTQIPCWGIKMTTGDEYKVDNEFGGKTTMYYFRLKGLESVSTDMLRLLVKSLETFGCTIWTFSIYDKDNEQWIQHPK